MKNREKVARAICRTLPAEPDEPKPCEHGETEPGTHIIAGARTKPFYCTGPAPDGEVPQTVFAGEGCEVRDVAFCVTHQRPTSWTQIRDHGNCGEVPQTFDEVEALRSALESCDVPRSYLIRIIDAYRHSRDAALRSMRADRG